MKLRYHVLPLTLMALSASPLSATTMYPTQFTCPVGGEQFEDYVVGSTSSWGQRPDGSAIGGVSPWPVVECPSNGLPLYKETFEEDELAKLATLIATPDYLAMRETETVYRRIWWLEKQLGADDYSLARYLISASWETEFEPERKARYQRDFATAANALVRTSDQADNWFWLTLRAANAYRELGRYSDAARLVSEADRADLMPEDAEQREGARSFIDQLSPLIAEQNPTSQPTNMVGARNAAMRCTKEAAGMTAVEQDACDTPEYREAIAKYQEYVHSRKKPRRPRR